MSSHEFQSLAVQQHSISMTLQNIFTSRIDHRISLIDFLRQHVDSPGNKVSLQISAYLKDGLNISFARKAYEQQGSNEVISPQQCPAILCCLLPCLNNTPTMKAYNNNRPDTATVTRYFNKNKVTGNSGGSKRIVMDSASLVVGDIITVYEGDLVPADCRIVDILNEPLEVDVSLLFSKHIGNQCSIVSRVCTTIDEDYIKEKQVDNSIREQSSNSGDTDSTILEATNMLLAGCTLLSGTALCVVTATGENMVWSTMIKSKLWPPS